MAIDGEDVALAQVDAYNSYFAATRAARYCATHLLIAESEANKDLRGKGAGLAECCVPGSMVVVDLTDPLLARDEANGIFQVLTEQYRSRPMKCGKLLALDEVRPSVRQSSQSVKHIKSIRHARCWNFSSKCGTKRTQSCTLE